MSDFALCCPTTEPCIRINVLANISPLLDKNLSLQDHGAESVHDIEEKLFGIPVKMLVDINLQVQIRGGLAQLNFD